MFNMIDIGTSEDQAMVKRRILARIDVKNEHVIKGIHLEGLRKVGDPNELAKRYYNEGIDEIFFMDAVAAYYDRNSLSHIIEKACREVFVPITVGGGIRTVKDIQVALEAGADKVAINTQAIRSPQFIEEAAKIFGSQCIVLSIDAKSRKREPWEAYYDNGREPSGLNVIEWAKKGEELGAGEILVTSIDQEGTKKGFDEALMKAVVESLSIPVIASGGAGNAEHVQSLMKNIDVDGVALASVLHYGLLEIGLLKQGLAQRDVKVRLSI